MIRLLLTREDLDMNLVCLNSKEFSQVGWSPLFYAVAGGKIEIVEMLLRRSDVNRDLKDIHGRTPAQLASLCGFLEIRGVLEDYNPL